jgi:dephospho-CoA kinase
VTVRRTGEARAAESDGAAAADRSLVIGLTGPIGCGKSTVAGWLASRGAVVIDADAVARDVTAPGEPGHEAVLAHFGDAFRRADGTLDRAALGRLVFDDADALEELERIVHPLVRPRIVAAIETARAAAAPIVVLEAIKLLEAGYGAVCDAVWLITCQEHDQLERLVARGLGARDARQRVRAQAGLAGRLAGQVNAVIDTSGTLEEAERRVDRALVEARRSVGRGRTERIGAAPHGQASDGQ